jgi:hypothetical protein
MPRDDRDLYAIVGRLIPGARRSWARTMLVPLLSRPPLESDRAGVPVGQRCPVRLVDDPAAALLRARMHGQQPAAVAGDSAQPPAPTGVPLRSSTHLSILKRPCEGRGPRGHEVLGPSSLWRCARRSCSRLL